MTDMKKFVIPRCKFRDGSPKLFPDKFKSKPEEIKFLTHNDESTKEYFSKLTLEEYHKDFKKRPKYYDLHNSNFQNFAISTTHGNSPKELRRLSLSKEASDKRLLRCRVYGISTQDCWDWNGGKLHENSEEMKRKGMEMEDIHKSLSLYDWAHQPKDIELPKRRYEETASRFFRMGTQECVLRIYQEQFENEKVPVNKEKEEEEEEGESENENGEEEHSSGTSTNDTPTKIAWLNLANAHHVCGIYFSVLGGSQEEEVATNCTGCASLGICGKFHSSGPRSWVLGKGIHYREAWHIPPGGNYFCKTRFLTGDPCPVDCYMIASAFCDLRKYIPYVHVNSERGDYYDFFGGLRCKKKGKESYLEERLKFDIEGCVRTAVLEGIDILVAGASGCGAFKHDPKVEAQMWSQVLEKYQGYFKEVVFAVLDKEDSDNVKYFKKLFGEEKVVVDE